MTEIKILNETPISLVETRTMLEKIETRDKELSDRATKTKEHINRLIKKTDDHKGIKEKLEKLDIARLKPRHIAKLTDIQPKDLDSLKTIMSGENITLKQEDLKKVLECLK